MAYFEQDELKRCYDFALNMIGNHNPKMIYPREDWEIFRDDFRGKLGEVAFRKYILNYTNAEIKEDIDYAIYPRKVWDSNDIVLNVDGNDIHINVKSGKGGSEFLMIETKRYKANGEYAYQNNDNTPVRVDAYAFVQVAIKPEYSERDFKHKSLERFMSYDNRKISYYVLGAISHEDFWKNKHFADAGIKCSKDNLRKVCRGEQPEMAKSETKKENVLQQPNYILDGMSEVEKINGDLLRRLSLNSRLARHNNNV